MNRSRFIIITALTLAMFALAFSMIGCKSPTGGDPGDTTAPVLSDGSVVDRTSHTEATISFTSDEAGTGYYLVMEKDDTAPSKADIKAAVGSAFEVTVGVNNKAVTLEAGEWDIYVVEVDAAGNISNILLIQVAAYVANPTAPAAPGNFSANPHNTYVDLTWTTPNNGGSAITKYQVSHGTTAGYTANWTDIPSSGASTVTHTVSSLTNGTSYTFEVRAINAIGNGTTSGTKTATPSATDTTAPTLSAGSVNRTSDTAATISFTTNEAGTAYYVQLNSGASTPTSATVKAGTSLGAVTSGANTGKAVILTAGARDIYVVVEDAAGNISTPLKISAAAYVALTYTITATPTPLTFGSLTTPYTQPSVQTVTVTNTGTGNITLNTLPTVANYTLTPGANWTSSFAPGATKTFTVRPNASLAAGNYDRSITVTGNNDATATVNTTFSVTTVAAKPVTKIDWVYKFDNGVPGGESLGFEVEILPTDATDKRVKWTSSNTAIAIFNNGEAGVATTWSTNYNYVTIPANAPSGQVTITAASVSNPDVKATHTITVTAAVGTISSVVARPGTIREGSNDYITYDFTTTNFVNGEYPITINNLPAGIIVYNVGNVVNINNNNGILMLGGDYTQTLGTHTNLTLTIGGVTSTSFTIKIVEDLSGIGVLVDVNTFAQLKTTLETPGTATITITENITETLGDLQASYNLNASLIYVAGTKTIKMNSKNITITNNQTGLKGLYSFINVASGAKLTVFDYGVMSCDFNANGNPSAVIFNSGGTVVLSTATFSGGTGALAGGFGVAINTNSGTTAIISGLYIGRVNNFAQGGLAVSVGGSGTTIINDGRFEVTAGHVNDTNLASVSVATTTATLTLNGGGFYQGINGGTRNISTFLGAGKSLYTAELYGTTVPANVTRVTQTVWVR